MLAFFSGVAVGVVLTLATLWFVFMRDAGLIGRATADLSGKPKD